MKQIFSTVILLFVVFQVSAKEPSRADYVKAGDSAMKKKSYDKALELYKKANKSQSSDVLDKIAEANHGKKDYVEEIRALELIQVNQKLSPNQLTRLGLAYSEIGKTAEAVNAFRESIQSAPKYEKAYQGMYDLYIRNGRFEDARQTVMQVFNNIGEKKEWLNEYCRVEFEQKYFEDTKNICQKAIMKDPKMPDNHVYLALAFKFTDNSEQARKILFKAAKQFLKSDFVQWNAGQLAEEIQNWELAQQQYMQCIRVNREAGECYLQLGKVLFELKKYEKSLKALMKACPYEKGVDVTIRKFSYDLEKLNKDKESKMFSKETDKCDLLWFENSKKLKK
jgi:tetratricopeptide (TPR) repeat protein